jgi:protein-tyrosine-phosphatase
LETFSVTFVCTGNRFRSPLAEAFVRRLTLGLPVSTESYGTLRLENVPAQPEAVEIALACGVSLAAHHTRYVSDASLADADLVLGFEPAHIQQAVVDAHAPRDRTFTLGDLISLLPTTHQMATHEDVVKRARSLVAAAGERAESGLRPMETMRDPFGSSWKVYRQTAAEIRELSLALVERLFGTVDTQALPPIPEKLGRRRRALWR